MKKAILILGVVSLLLACNQSKEKKITETSVAVEKTQELTLEERADLLKKEGYQIFLYKEGDSTYLMQQYYMVFLKNGENRDQDSTETVKLQSNHLAHLERMAVEGYASLVGPLESDGDIRGIVVYNTKTLKEADSLANMDPMVKAGRLKVEVHPWWTQKGGKLN
ncbi:uncharacterized protein YciI [Gillisia mitskevichiae]|uniref:Uncharacterized protein YciI n=1 Tax=Gillisia mitskevichiae TaxID=270921 RepID=A0A495PXK5_9FLAO|nr:YciI family protein [Gillisia mitskevichiae]RKS55297.1 uncharacterized protein YciI [Gillisia mitskevichiae]